nr:replication-relaxation family protein [Burkholderia savannae]
MAHSTNTPTLVPRGHVSPVQGTQTVRRGDATAGIPARQLPASRGHAPQPHSSVTQRHRHEDTAPRKVDQGLTSEIHPQALQQIVWLRALETVNRFRVVRAIDIALSCFPERTFKASLTAAQRAMRGLAKAKLVRRYRTERFQHVYGLTVAGARWLQDHGVDAAASVRRVADMSNPEHALWMNVIVLACEARGLQAMTEAEALRKLNEGRDAKAAAKQGFITVEVRGKKRTLRPDAIAYEPDGVTWFEIDRSKRGADREAALSALVGRVGVRLENDLTLRRIVLFARTDRIRLRAQALLRARVRETGGQQLTTSAERRFSEIEDGLFEVWAMVWTPARQCYVDQCVGHVILQLLPTWLPKARLDSSNRQPLSGWLNENYLPYRRLATSSQWLRPTSPFLPVVKLKSRSR